MRTKTAIAVTAALLLLAGTAVWADDGGGTTGSVAFGGWATSTSGLQERVNEYSPTGENLELRFDLATRSEDVTFDMRGGGSDSTTQDFFMDLDVKRQLRFKVDFIKLLHRLPHDPGTNLAAAMASGKTLQHDDLDASAQYSERFSLMSSHLEWHPESLSRLTLGLHARGQVREGIHQSMNIAHCYSCHVTSQSRSLHERTSDVGVSARYEFSRATGVLQYTHRTLDQGGARTLMTYDRTYHPVTGLYVFDNRSSFDSRNGPLPVDYQPETTKDSVRLDFNFPDVARGTVDAGGVWTRTRNDLSGLDSKYLGFATSGGHKLTPRLTVRWGARYYTLSSDDVFVDIVEPVGIAGPQTGQTYQDATGFVPDFWRYSSLDRDVFEYDASATFRIGKRAGTLTGTWKGEAVDRDHFEVAEGQTKTLSNRITLVWRPRPTTKDTLRFEFSHLWVSYPFTNTNGSCATLTAPGTGSPFTGTQYYLIYDSRVADVSGLPDSEDALRMTYTHRFSARTTFTGALRWSDSDNTTGDRANWHRDNLTAVLSVWGAPTDKAEWYANYSYGDYALEMPACVPLYDG